MQITTPDALSIGGAFAFDRGARDQRRQPDDAGHVPYIDQQEAFNTASHDPA